MGPPREPKISKKHWRVVQKSTFPAFRFEAPLVPLWDPFSAHFGAPNGFQNGPESTPKITSKFVPSKDAQIGLQRPSKGPQVGPQIGPKSVSDPSRTPSGHHETPNPPPGALRTPSWTPPGPPGTPREPLREPPGTSSEPLWTLLGEPTEVFPGTPPGTDSAGFGLAGFAKRLELLIMAFRRAESRQHGVNSDFGGRFPVPKPSSGLLLGPPSRTPPPASLKHT